MRARCECKISFPDEHYLEVVFKALKPEVDKPTTMRSRASLKKEDTFLILTVEARDTVAFRAALNAYLRWISSMAKVFEVLETL